MPETTREALETLDGVIVHLSAIVDTRFAVSMVRLGDEGKEALEVIRSDLAELERRVPVHDRIAAAKTESGTPSNNDSARTLAFAAIRDGENWNDRRLPEVGRALDAALDEVDALLVRVAYLEDELRELARS